MEKGTSGKARRRERKEEEMGWEDRVGEKEKRRYEAEERLEEKYKEGGVFETSWMRGKWRKN